MRAAEQLDSGGDSTRKRGTKRKPTWLTETELAGRFGISPKTVSYRVLKGQLTGPNKAGLYDEDRAREEFRRHPIQHTGRKASHSKTQAGRRQEPEAEQDEETPQYDPDTRYRLAKASQEEIKLSKMREESVDLRGAIRRAFHFVRTWREMMDAWVSQEGPLMAADLAVDEGAMWRRLKKGMTRLQERCSEVQLNLTEDPKTEDEEQEDETAEAEPPKPKRGPGRPRKGT